MFESCLVHMSFWEAHAVAEQARRDEYLDLEPMFCFWCEQTKRGVILGICGQCFLNYEAELHATGNG